MKSKIIALALAAFLVIALIAFLRKRRTHFATKGR